MDDLFGLAGKNAVVIGGGLGIGRASSELLARAGAAVAVVDIERERAESVAAALGRQGTKAAPIVANVLDRQQAEAAIQQAADQLGGLDVLVNVVGRSGYRPLIEMSEDELEATLSLNMKYVFRCCTAFARLLGGLGHGGAIVNIASVAGLGGSPGNSAYGASKAALISLTRSMAVEWAEREIRVNAVAPGLIATDHWLSSRGERAAEEASWRVGSIPMGRMGDQTEVAKVVLFLASDLASYVTGEVVVLDGGRQARPPSTEAVTYRPQA